jgi:hypothetical protein
MNGRREAGAQRRPMDLCRLSSSQVEPLFTALTCPGGKTQVEFTL